MPECSLTSPAETGELYHSAAALALDDTFKCYLVTGAASAARLGVARDLLNASGRNRVTEVVSKRRVRKTCTHGRATSAVRMQFESHTALVARTRLVQRWFSTLEDDVK
ncbi:MAG: hypothetical protein JWP97_6205, partial [Labilithrix sp.]|nr:hypothetical protein [Labilithrix sp.]